MLLNDKTRNIEATLPKLKKAYGDDYYAKYIKDMLDNLHGISVQIFLRALASYLAEQWQGRGPEHIISVVYDKILGSTQNSDITFENVATAFCEETTSNLLVNNFFKKWKQIGADAEIGDYKEVLNAAKEADVNIESLQKIYSFFQESTNYDCSLGHQEKFKAVVSAKSTQQSANLYLLLKDVEPVFVGPIPVDRNDWSEYQALLEETIQKLDEPDKSYTKIPEFFVLKKHLYRWKEQVYFRLKTWTEEPVAITPGKIELEIAPSMNVFSDTDEIERNLEWEYYIRGVAYHTGGADVEDLQILYSKQGGQELSVKVDEKKLSRGKYMKFALAWPYKVSEPIALSFHTQFKTLIPVGNTYESQSRDVWLNGLNIAPKIESYSIKEKINSPFIVGRPLTPDEFNRFGLSRPQQIAEELKGYLNYLDHSSLVVLEGLRQSGKTTIINVVLDKIDVVPDERPPKYFVIKSDLMAWWKEYIEDITISNVSDYRYQFWHYCRNLYFNEWERLQRTGRAGWGNQIDIQRQKDSTGKNTFQNFKKLIITLREKTGVRLLLVVDDADIFAYFKNEIPTLVEEIVSLCDETDSVIWTANDNRSGMWLDKLRESFHAKISYGRAEQKTLKTYFLDKGDMKRLLTTESLASTPSLAFTPLAQRAAYIFTGGWISLIQRLGQEMVISINNKITDNNDAYRLITVEDIREIVYRSGFYQDEVFDYLAYSFTGCEIVFMQVLSKEGIIDSDTGILQGITFSNGWMGRHFLEERIQQVNIKEELEQDVCDILKNRWQVLLYQLKEKGILEHVTFHGQLLPLVKFRSGWLYTYLRHTQYFECMVDQKNGGI